MLALELLASLRSKIDECPASALAACLEGLTACNDRLDQILREDQEVVAREAEEAAARAVEEALKAVAREEDEAAARALEEALKALAREEEEAAARAVEEALKEAKKEEEAAAARRSVEDSMPPGVEPSILDESAVRALLGRPVRISGLERTNLNGRVGRVYSWHARLQRAGVQLLGDARNAPLLAIQPRFLHELHAPGAVRLPNRTISSHS